MSLAGCPQNQPRYGLWLVLAIFAATIPAAAVPASAVSRYLAACQRLQAVTDIPPAALASFDASLSGLALELRGEVVAIVSPDQAGDGSASRCMLLQTDQGVTVAVDYYADTELEPAAGQRVAVLARIPDNPRQRGHLQAEYMIPEEQLPGQRTGDTASGTSHQESASSSADSSGATTADAAVQQPPQSVPPDVYAPERIQIWQQWISKHNPDLSKTQRERIVQWVLYHCYNPQYDLHVDHRLIFSVILAESGFHPNSRSHAGAQGLMQLMPSTAQGLGITDAYYIPENIRGGVEYLAKYLRQYRGETNYRQCVLALACYNAGPNAVKKYGGVPPFPETRRYVIKVTQQFHDLAQAGYP